MTIREKWCKGLIKDGTEECGVTENLRFFNSGWKCPIHTENAMKGIPEYPSGPGIPAYRPCGKCSHIRREHTTSDPLTPGRCQVCSDGHQYSPVD